MDDAADKSNINEIGTIFVPVSDQEQSLGFFVGKLGFEKRVDFVYGAEKVRWIEVAPPGAKNTISLVPAGEGTAATTDRTFCAFSTTDIEADHQTISGTGVVVDDAIASEGGSRQGLVSLDTAITDPVPAQFTFRDPDGNRFLMVQPG